MVFIKAMKTKSLRKIRESGLHKGDEDQIAFEKSKKVVFIKVMKTKSLLKIKESGLHKGDEDQIPSENQRKWSS